ncbi:hypothetical protein [Bacillus sp. JJ722]|uniref:hypothetical protein n=1 Tax=Bacillus sp. JJ722 TaxID=3122973 RepID=UPI00300074EE
MQIVEDDLCIEQGPSFLNSIGKEQLNLLVSGMIMMILTPVIGFLSGALILNMVGVREEQEKVQAMMEHF